MTPDSNNLYVGAGEVWFDRFDASGNSTGLRHLGNVDSLEITPTVDTIEKKSSMSGTRATLKKVVTGSKAEIALKLAEFDIENLALALMGQSATYNQSTSTATDKSITTSLVLDVAYDLGGLNPTVTTVKQGATTLDPQAYKVDVEAGTITFLSSYNGANKATAGTAVTWTGSIPALTSKKKIEALSVGKIEGRLRYKSAADQVAGSRVLIDVWDVSINPDGALALISEEFGAIGLKGDVLQVVSRTAGEQFFRVIYL